MCCMCMMVAYILLLKAWHLFTKNFPWWFLLHRGKRWSDMPRVRLVQHSCPALSFLACNPHYQCHCQQLLNIAAWFWNFLLVYIPSPPFRVVLSAIWNVTRGQWWPWIAHLNYKMYCNAKHIKTIILNATSSVNKIFLHFAWYDPYSNMD